MEEKEQELRDGRTEKKTRESQWCWNGVQVRGGETANGVGPFSGGGNPKALEQLPQTDCGLQKGTKSGHVPHSPCPISFSDLSLPQLDLPRALAH